MNIDEFNEASGQLVARAMNEGVLKDTMNCFEVLGVLEQRQSEVLRFIQQQQDAAASKKMQENKPLIVAAGRMPGRG
jgi:hypothetical protein